MIQAKAAPAPPGPPPRAGQGFGAAPLQPKAALARPGPPPLLTRPGGAPIQAKTTVPHRTAPPRPGAIVQRAFASAEEFAARRKVVALDLAEFKIQVSGPYVGKNDDDDFIYFKIETFVTTSTGTDDKAILAGRFGFAQTAGTTYRLTRADNGHLIRYKINQRHDDKYSIDDFTSQSGGAWGTTDHPGVKATKGQKLVYTFIWEEILTDKVTHKQYKSGAQKIEWTGTYEQAEQGHGKVSMSLLVFGGSSYESATAFY